MKKISILSFAFDYESLFKLVLREKWQLQVEVQLEAHSIYKSIWYLQYVAVLSRITVLTRCVFVDHDNMF